MTIRDPKARRFRRLLWLGVIGILILTVLIFAPGPIEGCYLEEGAYFNKTEGHAFSYIAEGRVFSCNDTTKRTVYWGPYEYQKNVGWVWKLQTGGAERRVL